MADDDTAGWVGVLVGAVFISGMALGWIIGASMMKGRTEIDYYSGTRLGEEIAEGMIVSACINQRGDWDRGVERCRFKEEGQ